MCGIVCFFGRSHGVERVLDALLLLEYRAPDSTGIAAINELGELAVQRSVGPPRRLAERLAQEPLERAPAASQITATELLRREGLRPSGLELRDCSAAAGWRIEDLYRDDGLKVGIGDWGRTVSSEGRYANRGSGRPNLDEDPVRHAFRLVATHVASRIEHDPGLLEALNETLRPRLPAGSRLQKARGGEWQQAWRDEVAANVPGHAFAVAVRHFQAHTPGLAQCLAAEDWERVGGATARAMPQIVVGHGRWAMVGAVTEDNAHPLADRSGTRVVCENGSHNAALMLAARTRQDTWWRDRGVPAGERVHRSENTTEVVAYEWERAALQLAETSGLNLDETDRAFLEALRAQGIEDVEEQALRMALRRLSEGNAHACAFYCRHRPGTLFVSSQDKAIAIAVRAGCDSSCQEIIVASDVNAALALWPGTEVQAAAKRISDLQRTAASSEAGPADREAAQAEIEAILDAFLVDVILLESDGGPRGARDLFACIQQRVQAEHGQSEQIAPEIRVTRYDGTPVAVAWERVRLNPAMVGKGISPSYTEAHIAEIPGVMDQLVRSYVPGGQLRLESDRARVATQSTNSPGLNLRRLQQRFGPGLERLCRLVLIGEGSSWRDAQAAAPLMRELLPGVLVVVYRPIEVLNLGEHQEPERDLAIEISWSGTTDSLLKVDRLLAGLDVLRVAVTGRPQSDLGRRAARSAGTLYAHTGVEVSVATVKGFQGILMTLDLLALRLAELRSDRLAAGQRSTALQSLASLINELTLVVPRQVRAVIEDEARRARIRQVAQRCQHFNKVAVVGDSPVDIEGELKIEELAQVVAVPLGFHAGSLRALIERSALAPADAARPQSSGTGSSGSLRTLFVVNATSPTSHRAARPILSYLRELDVFAIVHTTLREPEAVWGRLPNAEIFHSPAVSETLQPLIDAPFFFDLAVALAYARGLSPEAIDRPRNLAKSVTTTGAESRAEAEKRAALWQASIDTQRLADGRQRLTPRVAGPLEDRAALRATVAMRGALAVLGDPPPEMLHLKDTQHLVVIADSEATENAAAMARAAWREVAGVDLTVFRRFGAFAGLAEEARAGLTREGTAFLRLDRGGAVLAAEPGNTADRSDPPDPSVRITLPVDLSPLQVELLGAAYLIGLAIRLARQRGSDTEVLETVLAGMPVLAAEMLASRDLRATVDGALRPYVQSGYDKLQVIGGGQDHASAASIARSVRYQGFMAEALYTDSAWHGPLATVGGPDAAHDTLIAILATDPLFRAAALVDTQVYRARNAQVLLVVPEGSQHLAAVHEVDAQAVIPVPAAPRPLAPIPNAVLGEIMARSLAALWDQAPEDWQAVDDA